MAGAAHLSKEKGRSASLVVNLDVDYQAAHKMSEIIARIVSGQYSDLRDEINIYVKEFNAVYGESCPYVGGASAVIDAHEVEDVTKYEINVYGREPVCERHRVLYYIKNNKNFSFIYEFFKANKDDVSFAETAIQYSIMYNRRVTGLLNVLFLDIRVDAYPKRWPIRLFDKLFSTFYAPYTSAGDDRYVAYSFSDEVVLPEFEIEHFSDFEPSNTDAYLDWFDIDEETLNKFPPVYDKIEEVMVFTRPAVFSAVFAYI